MDTQLLGQIDSALRSGKATAALELSKQYCEKHGAGKESGIEIAKAAAGVYRDLISPPVVEFVEAAAEGLPGEAGTIIQKAVQRLFRIHEDWDKKLWDVHRERLCRELRDWIRSGHREGAMANCARLLGLVDPSKRTQRATYIGTVMGTVLNHQKDAALVVQAMLKNPEKHYMTRDEVLTIDTARQKRSGQLAETNIDNLERQWFDVVNGLAVDIKNMLPGEDKMGDPEDAILRDLGDVFRSILRVPIVTEQPDLFLDATNILREFVEKEQSSTAKMARIEGRTYNTLGFTAKKAVNLTFLEVGKNKFFTQMYNNWALNYVGSDEMKSIIEVMGAFRSAEFGAFLKNLKSSKSFATSASRNDSIATALGSIAGEEATDDLITELRGLLHKKRLDMADIKRAEGLVSSLGMITKSARTERSERKKIREFLRSHIPEDLTKLACFTALQAFTYKPAEENPDFRKWAIRSLARGLWLPDDTTSHHKGGDQVSPLGFRQEIVDALVRLGKEDIHTVVSSMEPLSSRYGAAYIAASETLEKLNEPEGLNALERMLNNALLHTESDKNIYQQEMIWDPAREERVPLSKDMVLEPLVHAIGTIGGPKAGTILQRYLDQIKSGRVAPPSPNVANFLDRFKGESGEFETEGGSSVPPPVTDDPEIVKALLKQLNKSYWLSGKTKRRMMKVQALTQLAQVTPLEAIEPVFKHLADKDLMVSSAAISCLAEYAAEDKKDAIKNEIINSTLERLESRDPAMRSGATKLLRAMGPNRKDIKPKLLQFAKHTERREAREAISQAIKTGGGSATPDEQLKDLGSPSQVPDTMSALEAKQQYMQARQAWIRGGKKGDPPPKPDGMD